MSEETTRRRHLGRGLSALFGEEAEAPGRPPVAGPVAMPIEFLGPGPRQPRRVFDAAGMVELVASVRERGILQPLIVRPDPAEAGRYEIVAGERRWRAAQRAQLHEVPVIVRELDDREALEVALIENIQRRDLTPIEEAEGLIRLMDEFGYTQKALAEAVGKSRGHVANMLRLLQLPAGARTLLAEGALSAGHARALAGAENPETLAGEVVRRGLNVRQTERLVLQARAAASPRPRPARPPRDHGIVELEDVLTRDLGLRVAIKTRGVGGALVIHYELPEQLERVLDHLKAGLAINTSRK